MFDVIIFFRLIITNSGVWLAKNKNLGILIPILSSFNQKYLNVSVWVTLQIPIFLINTADSKDFFKHEQFCNQIKRN